MWSLPKITSSISSKVLTDKQKTLFLIILGHISHVVVLREGVDIGLFIILVPTDQQLWGLLLIFIGLFIELNVQKFNHLIWSTEGVILCTIIGDVHQFIVKCLTSSCLWVLHMKYLTMFEEVEQPQVRPPLYFLRQCWEHWNSSVGGATPPPSVAAAEILILGSPV